MASRIMGRFAETGERLKRDLTMARKSKYEVNGVKMMKAKCPFCQGHIVEETRLCAQCGTGFPKGFGSDKASTRGIGHRADKDEGGPSWDTAMGKND